VPAAPCDTLLGYGDCSQSHHGPPGEGRRGPDGADASACRRNQLSDNQHYCTLNTVAARAIPITLNYVSLFNYCVMLLAACLSEAVDARCTSHTPKCLWLGHKFQTPARFWSDLHCLCRCCCCCALLLLQVVPWLYAGDAQHGWSFMFEPVTNCTVDSSGSYPTIKPGQHYEDSQVRLTLGTVESG
jgi:hypothetical protein